MLEVVNRARLNPDGEVYRLRNQTWGDTGSPRPPDLNEGITSNLLGPETRQPLTFNDKLIESARDYSQTLLSNNDFQHYFGGTTPQTRMQAAGYVFSGAGGWRRTLSLTYASFVPSISASLVDSQYDGLFIDGNVSGRGHRENLLNDSLKEIGIGLASTFWASYTPPGGSGKWYAVIGTQDFRLFDRIFKRKTLPYRRRLQRCRHGQQLLRSRRRSGRRNRCRHAGGRRHGKLHGDLDFRRLQPSLSCRHVQRDFQRRRPVQPDQLRQRGHRFQQREARRFQ